MRKYILAVVALCVMTSCIYDGDVVVDTIEVETKAEDATRIVTYNIRCCKGMDGLVNYNRTATVIKAFDADIVAIQELDSANNLTNELVDGQELADRLDMYMTFGPAIIKNGGEYGVGLLSKEAPITYYNYSLPGTEEMRTLLIVEFLNYYVAVTHLSLVLVDRLESIEIVEEIASGMADKPFFFCGDLNAQPSSTTIAYLQNSFSILSDTTVYTYSSTDPERTIDYITAYDGDDFGYHVTAAGVLFGVEASDHLPVYADIVFKEL